MPSTTSASVRPAQPPVRLTVSPDTLWVEYEGRRLPVSLRCPRLIVDGVAVGGASPTFAAGGDVASGRTLRLTYAPIPLDGADELAVEMRVRWSARERLLRKWATVRVRGREVVLKQLVFDDIDLAASGLELAPVQPVFGPPQSYPVFIRGFFVGVEHPIASTRLEGAHAIIAHKPGMRIGPGRAYETRKAVYGVTPPGDEKATFQRYVMSHRHRGMDRLFVWEPWVTTHIPYDEGEAVAILKAIEEKLYKPHGVSVDASIVTAGWSNKDSIWEADPKRFPGGLEAIRDAGLRSKTRMALWVSPSSVYDFAQDAKWAARNGYETMPWGAAGGRTTCLGGPRYAARFRERMVDLFTRYDIAYAYFDGYVFECPETSHGHQPGDLSAETCASNLIDVFQSIRRVRPKTWLEAVCVGANPSPWWLFHVDSVIGNYGSDCCWGRVPAPVYRESHTTARDAHNMQGVTHGLIPPAAQDIYAGLYCHTREPMVNDAVMGVMRGNLFYMLCTNPAVVSDYGWSALAALIRWARRNVSLFAATQPLPPASWQNDRVPRYSYAATTPREPYGYAHWNGVRGIVALRNPWSTWSRYSVMLDPSSGLSPTATGLSAVSLYPENRLYGRDLRAGSILDVPLAPYETVVLEFGRRRGLERIPVAPEGPGNGITVDGVRTSVRRVRFGPVGEPMGKDSTDLMAGTRTALRVEASATVNLAAPTGELALLVEEEPDQVADIAAAGPGELLAAPQEKPNPVDPLCRMRINGVECDPVYSGPDLAYAGEAFARPEQWLFLRYPLRNGPNTVEVELTTRSARPVVSILAWANKPGRVDGSAWPNSLPQPEAISVDAATILSPVGLGSAGLASEAADAPVEPIDGVFLDALRPTEATGLIGTNLNALLAPLTLRGRTYRRGLHVAAPSEVFYALDGSFRRFRAWVGVDGGTPPYDKSAAEFEVRVDGVVKWSSKRLSRWDDPVAVDVDLANAKSLQLVVRNLAKQGALECRGWCNWANAHVLR